MTSNTQQYHNCVIAKLCLDVDDEEVAVTEVFLSLLLKI